MPLLPDLAGVLSDRRTRYLLAGGFNTAIGYAVGVGLYLLLSHCLHIVVIGLLANVLSISVSFVTYKLFVFRTRGLWLSEYLRSYVVYGTSALLGVGLLWVFVKGISLNIWLAQGMVIASGVAISYVGHATFTFRRREPERVVD